MHMPDAYAVALKDGPKEAEHECNLVSISSYSYTIALYYTYVPKCLGAACFAACHGGSLTADVWVCQSIARKLKYRTHKSLCLARACILLSSVGEQA